MSVKHTRGLISWHGAAVWYCVYVMPFQQIFYINVNWLSFIDYLLYSSCSWFSPMFMNFQYFHIVSAPATIIFEDRHDNRLVQHDNTCTSYIPTKYLKIMLNHNFNNSHNCTVSRLFIIHYLHLPLKPINIVNHTPTHWVRYVCTRP